jgi:hypothetical protein
MIYNIVAFAVVALLIILGSLESLRIWWIKRQAKMILVRIDNKTYKIKRSVD